MFSDAVQEAIAITSAQDTLIIVTADHDHTMTMSGYAVKENGILGNYNVVAELIVWDYVYLNTCKYMMEYACLNKMGKYNINIA